MPNLRRTAIVRIALIFFLTATVPALVESGLAQTAAGPYGEWHGTLGGKLRLVVKISKSADGLILGSLQSVDQGNVLLPIDRIDVKDNTVRLELKAVGGTYEGVMSSDGTTMKGTWTQVGVPPQPLEFTRAAAAAPAATAPAAAAPAATAAPAFAVLDIDAPPTPFLAGGKTHLVYELHITNFGAADILLSRLEVLAGSTVLATLDGAALNEVLMRPGPPPGDDRRLVGPGLRAIAYLWVTLDAGTPAPARLAHRLTIGDQKIETAARPLPPAAPIVIGPPLRGEDWIAFNGPSNASNHRRALIPIDGQATLAQRFAIDWVQLGANGRSFDGEQRDNKSYRAYGAEILAVADATVSAVRDGIPENVPGPTSRAVPITRETIAGNHVILDLGGGRYAFYAHLQPGSLRVKVGDTVKRGQVLGLVGNSGNSTEPHLHFHVADRSSPLGAQGLPYLLDAFEIRPQDVWEPRQRELPLQNARVRFAAK
jgi:hypothetical protein